MRLLTNGMREKLLRNGRIAADYEEGGIRRADFLPVVKLFTPDAGCTWILSELDPDDPDLAYGLCDRGRGFPELGSVRLSEIEAECAARSARGARPAFQAGAHAVGLCPRGGEDRPSLTTELALSDLLTDLMHYTDGQGIDFTACTERAAAHHAEERAGVVPTALTASLVEAAADAASVLRSRKAIAYDRCAGQLEGEEVERPLRGLIFEKPQFCRCRPRATLPLVALGGHAPADGTEYPIIRDGYS